MQVDQFLTVTNLRNIEPDMKTTNPLGLLNKGKGESVYLNCLNNIKYIGALEFLPGLGMRGKHYHKNKKEIMYVLEGKVKGYYWLPEEPERLQEKLHEKGDLITMQPGLTHAFEAMERTVMIELSPNTFDIEDTFYPNNMLGR